MLDLSLNVDFSGKVVVVTGAGGVLCGTMAWACAKAAGSSRPALWVRCCAQS